MNVFPLPMKKNSRLFLAPVAVFLILALPCCSQKTWKTIVFTGSQKIKGILYQVSDSSVVLMYRGNSSHEILFSNIHKIRLRRRFGKMEKVVGGLVGATTGAVVLSTTYGGGGHGGGGTAMGGIFGGLAGGLVGGGIGIALATPVYRLLSTRTYIIPHDALLYPSFAAKLRRYSVRR